MDAYEMYDWHKYPTRRPWFRNPIDVNERVHVKQWRSGSKCYYYIIGKEEDCVEYYNDCIPYFATIEKMGKYSMLVSRVDSSV
jgi:hypothetical protein